MTHVDTDDLSNRRTAAARKVETLKASRGAALLDDRDFDEQLLAAAIAEVDAIDDAIAEATRRDAVAAPQRHRDAYEAKMRVLAAAQKRRLEMVAETEKACRVFADVLVELVAATAEVERITEEFGTSFRPEGYVSPHELTERALITRLIPLAKNVFGAAFGKRYLGGLDLAVGGMDPVPGTPWLNVERQHGDLTTFFARRLPAA